MDVKDALTPREVGLTHELIDQLAERISQEEDLLALDDAKLMEDDTGIRSRIVYISSLINLERYLRTTVHGDELEKQARISMMYIKHAEANNLKVLQVGRSLADQVLSKKVDEAREALLNIAEYRAQRILSEQTQKTKPRRSETPEA